MAEKLFREGRLIADPQLECEVFERSYRWMVRQMAKRSLHCQYPVWAWYRHCNGRPRPDLRATGHLPPGTHGVLLQLNVESHRVLLSQFELWHCVLNNSHLSRSEADNKRVERREERGEVTQKEIEASWENIFDLKFGDYRYWGKLEERYIQACLPLLELSDVVKTTHFKAR
ncbi:hypothetical protein C5Y96_13985 [Blastopirellula marina]|uniref:DUF3841 domain-containing protein n=2 Tax=Pirellulales TaxID=2691354 RepID=A0A2S8FEJ0_9BACT|nr:hypothetical protein C5Y96_13985 [Blastopirellula marina]RCS50713.1 DUF3841 domain-containing protein [Bremerella cremea]